MRAIKASLAVGRSLAPTLAARKCNSNSRISINKRRRQTAFQRIKASCPRWHQQLTPQNNSKPRSQRLQCDRRPLRYPRRLAPIRPRTRPASDPRSTPRALQLPSRRPKRLSSRRRATRGTRRSGAEKLKSASNSVRRSRQSVCDKKSSRSCRVRLAVRMRKRSQSMTLIGRTLRGC